MERTFSSTPSQQPYSTLSLSPPPIALLSSSSSSSSSPSSSHSTDDFNLNNKVSPSILLIIIILAAIFFISALLHLLVRFLFIRPPNTRNPNELTDHTALQGQLQQLFHLHDSGVDQSFIDALPVFTYRAIAFAGAKEDPFDCAVCLSEFEGEDQLRLLPKCSHAFHTNCIDTWLLSHSTCPLCRASLLLAAADAAAHSSSPVVRINLESAGSESAVASRERSGGNFMSARYDGDSNSFRVSVEEPKSGEIGSREVLVKLGKFRNVDEGGSSERKGEVRRCYSMGSFAYIMDEDSSHLKVAIPSHDKIKPDMRNERDSFSISKIWLRGRKDIEQPVLLEESTRASSFRFPVAAGDGRSASEIESQCSNSLESEKDHPSFGRRTLLWFMGKAK